MRHSMDVSYDSKTMKHSSGIRRKLTNVYNGIRFAIRDRSYRYLLACTVVWLVLALVFFVLAPPKAQDRQMVAKDTRSRRLVVSFYLLIVFHVTELFNTAIEASIDKFGELHNKFGEAKDIASFAVFIPGLLFHVYTLVYLYGYTIMYQQMWWKPSG